MIDTSQMIPDILISKAEIEDAEELIAASKLARAFLLHHKWCRSIKTLYFDGGFKQLSVFFAVIDPIEADETMWVIVGDCPPAYLDTSVESAVEALEAYVDCMREWVDAVENGRSTDDVIPVLTSGTFDPVEENLEMAGMLKGRLSYIEEKIIPIYDEQLKLRADN